MAVEFSESAVKIDGQQFRLARRGIISISRLDFGVLSIYITPEMQVTGKATSEEGAAELATDLAYLVSSDAWTVDSIVRQPGGAYLVKMVAL